MALYSIVGLRKHFPYTNKTTLVLMDETENKYREK